MFPVEADAVAAVRRFNRFYTRRIDALARHHLATPFSLAESRVLYELAHREAPAARDLVADLGLDQGYLSRLLARFEARGLIARVRDDGDGRQSRIVLTEAGRETFAGLDRAAMAAVAAMMAPLAADERARLVGAMGRIEALLDRDAPGAAAPYLVRPPRPGDLGFVVHRQAVLYTQEYGWDERFEALVAEIAAEFIRTARPPREACWIAEREGEIVGSVMLVDAGEGTAKLRLLYVEPQARGLGIGRRLVQECVDHARRWGYGRLVLWTNDVLVAARRIYDAAGFRLTGEVRHSDFGPEVVGQTFELDLSGR